MSWVQEKLKRVGKPKMGAGENDEGGSWGYVILGVVIFVVAAGIVIAALNYQFPDFYSINTDPGAKPGTAFTQTLVTMTDEMASRWLPNDKVYPTVLLDNPQNFQLGELEAVRYTIRVMRDKLSRLRTTDKIDPDADAAFVLFSNDPFKWVLPSAESKYRDGVKALERYSQRLGTGAADFHPRADNLNELLDQWVSIMGGINTRLSNAPRRKGLVLTEETAGDQYAQGEKYVEVEIPWTQIDDNFYYAQGVAYAIRQMMQAVRYDFRHIIEIKKTDELVERILTALDQAQFEPLLVLNGDPGDLFANHSLQLQSLLEDARQKMRSLQDMVKE